GQLEFVHVGRRSEEENVYLKEVFPGFDVFLVNGHTDAMMIPHIRYKGRTIAYMADLLPSIHHIPLPWVMAYDTRPLLTMQEKSDFLEVAADEGIVLSFERPVNQCNVRSAPRRAFGQEAFPLSALSNLFCSIEWRMTTIREQHRRASYKPEGALPQIRIFCLHMLMDSLELARGRCAAMDKFSQ
ncbi:MAG: hypothetical protein IPJ85_13635, partial [Flavobacteriales bacterium]|nr:hypothetical protein [Flavobacteriales bacterium]